MQALVVVAHGSHRNPDSARPAFDHADRVRATGAFEEVRAAFWKEQPSLREVLGTLHSEEVYVVPLFMAEGYFTGRVVPRELRLEGFDGWDSDDTSAGHTTLRAADTGQTVHYCGPVGTHDAMTDVVVRRAESVTGDPGVGEGVGLAVVGHGTERNPDSAATTEYHARRIRERGRFAAVRALFMDEAPEVDDLTEHFDVEDVVLVPLFVADGYHTREDIPEDVGLADDHREGWDVPAEVDGHRVWYAGAVGTEPLVADVILERATDAGAAVPVEEREDGIAPAAGDAGTDGTADGTATDGRGNDDRLDEAGRAFLRWVEAAGPGEGGTDGTGDGGTSESGAARTLGQLRISVTRPGEDPRYDLRHVADAGADVADLERHEDPLDARELAREDDRGRFRPLAYAPTLPTGWAFPDLGPADLLAAVEHVYPAAVANWYLARAGVLDVTHWRAAAARHTGIYDVVEDLPRAGVEALATALCADCTRRREWEFDDGTPLDAPGDDGAVPCREPCSLAVAAAREFLALEDEGDDLEAGDAGPDRASLEAAADGRVEGVREGDVADPANPYRARYLLARREPGE